jgi:hypothetical protein
MEALPEIKKPSGLKEKIILLTSSGNCRLQ